MAHTTLSPIEKLAMFIGFAVGIFIIAGVCALALGGA